MRLATWLGVLLVLHATAALALPNGDTSLASAPEQRRHVLEFDNVNDADDEVDETTNADDDADDTVAGGVNDQANPEGRRLPPAIDQSKTARRRRRRTSAKDLSELRASNPTLYDGLEAWAKQAPTLNLTDAASAHSFLKQFVELQGRSVTWRQDKLPALLPYMRLLLPSASIPCDQACAPKMMEHLISPVSAVAAQRQGVWGVWYFVEAHKLLLNIKQHVRFTVQGCGVTEPVALLKGKTWIEYPAGDFEVLRNHRWYEVTRRTQPISSAFAKFWCPLPELLSASATPLPTHEAAELSLRMVWDASAGGWKRVQSSPELEMSTVLAPELKPWLKIQLDACSGGCSLPTFEPLVLPRPTKMGRLGIVVGLMHHQTPLLERFMDFYHKQYGATHFVFYTNESWVPAQEGHIPTPPGVTTSVYHWPSPLQTYKFGKSLALADFTDRGRFAFDWVLSIDVDEFIVFNPDPGEPTHFLDWLDSKVAEDEAIGCFTLLRHNVQRNCSDPATLKANSDTITLEQMRGVKDRFYVSPKAVYDLRKTQQLQIHRCWPRAKKKMMTFPEHKGWIAHLGRNEPNSEQCEHGPEWVAFSKASRISWWERFGEGGKVGRWFNAIQDLQARHALDIAV
eukprot:m.224296 g.224296  ORF g.224296 m.224296 type:complete len:625 (-) comp17285_c0_seq2:2815-4689(-)